MPERQARERLADWRAAERAEADSTVGSLERRRAHATSRRARWAFEDAVRAAGQDHGAAAESFSAKVRRGLRRLHEASDGAAEIVGGREPAEAIPETGAQRDHRMADEAEILRELGE